MRWIALLALVAAVGCRSGAGGGGARVPTRTEITASDGSNVFTEFVPAKGEPRGVVLMFHQAGSNLHEYDPIAPRIAERGWDCLKVDLRAGGALWGEKNLTAAQHEGEPSYESAYQDMLAALRWAERKGYERILAWGSSYSASLAFRLAAENKSVGAIVAFSPGEYFEEKGVVAEWNSRVVVPSFVAATSEELVTGVYEIVDAKPKVESRTIDDAFGTNQGVHGSSALRTDRCPDAELYWDRLERFFGALESAGTGFGG
jgi:dienelactone hydrolase